MQLQFNQHTWTWNSHWAQVPDNITLGYTHAVVVDRDGLVHVFNQSVHGVVRFNPDGSFAGTWEAFPSDRFVGAHGMTLVDHDGQQFLWLTDQRSAEVVRTTLDGRTVQTIGRPTAGPYADGDADYAPTWVAQNPDAGEIFVADGYGSGYINVYDRDGRYVDSMTGENGAGRFNCPHGVWIGRRTEATGCSDPVLYVTDRGNGRVQVYSLSGSFIKSFEQQHPCCFAEGPGGELLVPDLHAFINLYDQADNPIATHLGDNRGIVGQHGWPNVPHEMREAGKFNSPHGGTFDADGNIYIVEWIEDGRITKLEKTSA